MERIEIKCEREREYPDDVTRIKRVLQEKGLIANSEEAVRLWQMYSDSMCASWMYLTEEDEEVFDCISGYINNY